MNLKKMTQTWSQLFNSSFLSIVLLSQIVLIIYHSVHTIYGYDFFWHLRIGLDLLEKSWWPSVDRYSIDHYGQAYNYPMPVPFQFLIAIIYKLTSLEFTVASTLTFFGVIPLVLVKKLYGESIKETYFLGSAFILMTSAFLLRALPRPEVVSYLYLVIELFLVHKILVSTELKSSKTYWLLGLVFVQWIWVNTHFSSVIGYVVLFGVFSELIISSVVKKDFKKILNYCGFGLLALLSGFLTSGFHHPVLAALSFSSEWKHMVGEYFQPKMYGEEHYFSFVLSLVSLVIFIKNKNIAYAITNIVLLVQAVQVPKLFSVQIFVNTVCLLNYFSISSLRISRKLALVIFISVLGWQVSLISRSLNKTFWSGDYKMALPFDLSNYFIDSNLKPGNVFNDYEHGGYLMFRLADKLKIFIDGRTNILYPPQQMKLETYSKIHPRMMYELVDEKKIDYLITSLRKSDNAFEMGLRIGLFNLEYADKFHVLLKKGDKKYPKAEMLFVYPRCLSERDVEAIDVEMETLTAKLPKSSTPLRLLSLAKNYLVAEDKEVFLLKSKLPSEANAYDLRLLAVLNYNHGKWFNSLMYLDWIDKNFELSRRDKLLILKILAEVKVAGGHDSALKYIEYLGAYHQYLNDIDFLIYLELLDFFKNQFERQVANILAKPKLDRRRAALRDLKYTSDDLYKENCLGTSELKWKNNEK